MYTIKVKIKSARGRLVANNIAARAEAMGASTAPSVDSPGKGAQWTTITCSFKSKNSFTKFLFALMKTQEYEISATSD